MKGRKCLPKKEELLAAVQAAVKVHGGGPISVGKFVAASGMRLKDIYIYFATWNEALRAAGFDFQPYNHPMDAAILLADWGALARKLQRPPSMAEYDREGSYNASLLQSRAGTWGRLPGVFRKFAAQRAQWKDVMRLLPESVSPAHTAGKTPGQRRAVKKSATIANGRPVRGDHIGVGCMRYAPLNEIGVVGLFMLMAEPLGFEIEVLQTGFPDCEAGRRVGTGAWQSVRIEFEYESRNFRDHGHPPDGCDVIVCWVHNWAECPENLEVIELSKEIKRLPPPKTLEPQ